MAKNIVQNSEHGFSADASSRATQSGPEGAKVDIPSRAIQERAYFIFLARNGAAGDADADWEQAERELRAEAARKNRPQPVLDRVRESRQDALPPTVTRVGSAQKAGVSFSGG